MPIVLTYKQIYKRHKQDVAHDLRSGCVSKVTVTSKTQVNFS